MDVIELSGVSKKYHLYEAPKDRLREFFTAGRKRYHREHWALRDVSVRVRKGETFCIVGENGSGKSTLLKLMVGIVQPTAGTAAIRGRVTALLELGSGFNPEFTGRQNVFLNGAILGLGTREVSERLDQILEFAEIGGYVDQPVKTYSSGMVVRLAFAVAVHLDPDILIVDEALSVGDIYFRQRCMRKIHDLRARGVTIVYVTHDISDVKALGDRALWLSEGRALETGDARDVAVHYMAALVKKDSQRLRAEAAETQSPGAARRPGEVVEGLPEGALRHGDGGAEILGIRVCNHAGQTLEEARTPCRLMVRVSARARAEVALPIIGVQLRANGVDFAGSNTTREDLRLPAMRAGDIYTVDFHFQLPEMAETRFTVTPAIADGTQLEFRLCDMVEDAVAIRVLPGKDKVYGYMRLPCVAVTAARPGAPN
ncbi:MAG TPA: ABC transporter ATP-binding protein [Bryobacteraceae bacterium]|nr:ABC transporter ATP-binding protein [Bryobacteraceae bacterium]